MALFDGFASATRAIATSVGEAPQSEILEAALWVENRKRGLYAPGLPDMDTDIDIDAVVRQFDALRSGQFALDVTFRGVRGIAARIMGEPIDFAVNSSSDKPEDGLPTPDVEWRLPIMHLRNGEMAEETVQMKPRYLRSGVIGREAIVAMLDTVKFGLEHDEMEPEREITNLPHLLLLRRGVGELHQLGMEPVETGALDEAIAAGNRHDSRAQKRRALRRVWRRGTTAMPFGDPYGAPRW